ncbi:MAG: ABC transporter permease [Candidatus Andersenbacteria bacterium]
MPTLQLLVANLKMMFRNKQTLFWALVFPIIFIVVFGLFNLDKVSPSKIALIDQAKTPASQQIADQLSHIELLELQHADDVVSAKAQLAKGDIDFVLVVPAGFALPAKKPQQLTLFSDPTNVQANQIVKGTLNTFADKTTLGLLKAAPALEIHDTPVSSKNVRYVDFLLPGIIGQAIMFSAIIGTAVGVSRYREQQVLKRILATPLKVRSFLVAEISSRLVLALVQTSLVLVTAKLAFNVQVYGSLWYVYLLAAIGNIIFLQIGFTIAGLVKTSSAAEGLSNVITMPLLFLSGVFFATDTLPNVVQHVVKYLPLTPLVDVLRNITVDGDTPWHHLDRLAILGAWVVVLFVVASRTFKLDRESR